MSNVFEDLAQLLADLNHPESRRRRHLRRRLEGLSDELLHGAIEELFMALLLEADDRALEPLHGLLYEAWRRNEGAEDVRHAGRHVGPLPEEF